MSYSVAIPIYIHNQAVEHLLRSDGQEDVCFAIWYPSVGADRTSAVIKQLILPEKGERLIHGNAGFLPQYFERALSIASSNNAGLAFMHSHLGPGWQDMSENDFYAELNHAASVKGATGLPLVGLTLGTDGSWSARFWEKIKQRVYERFWCETVRIVGDGLTITYNDHLSPKPGFRKELERTVSAWGEHKQADLARMRVGIVGVGSVGSMVAEAIARMGITKIKLIDFDSVELVNMDRSLSVTKKDVGKAKVKVISNALRKSATAASFKVDPIEYSVVEENGFRNALDCDILFSCVDRPWPRSVLNFIAYAHLIPVVDGGITVRVSPNKILKGADWKAHIVGPTRKCLECLKQYDPGLVSVEREGYLDDATYISTLPDEHPIKRNENVFAFSMSAASLLVLQFLSMIISPMGIANVGEQNFHFIIGMMDVEQDAKCNKDCPYPILTAYGDRAKFVVTGRHIKAEEIREKRKFLKKSTDLILRSFFKSLNSA
jgi:molybdopterin/thiamine biosynthesis adenylyltransferase